MKIEDGKIKNDTTENQCSTITWIQMQDTESSIEEQPKIKIDLRAEGVRQDAMSSIARRRSVPGMKKSLVMAWC